MIFHYLGADEERMRKFRESALRITRGWDQERIRTLVSDTLIDVIEPIVYDEALELIREHQRAGRKVFIISASPEEIVEPLGRYLGVDGVIATRARIDDEGRYTGEVDFYSYGPFKAEAILEVANWEDIDLTKSYAYSDSMTDLPMLEVVGRPVVVNPDRELARIAKERDWEIRLFRIGVPLRERVPMPPPRLAAAVATTATIAAVGSRCAVVVVGSGRRRRHHRWRREPRRCCLGVLQLLHREGGQSEHDDEHEELLHDCRAYDAGGRRAPADLDGEQVAGAGVARGVAQLRHGPGLDLTDPLTGQVEVLTDLFERAGLAPIETEAQLQDLALTLVERAEQPGDLLGQQRRRRDLEGRFGRAVLDDVAELGVAVLAQGLGQRQRLGREAQAPR